MKEKEVVADGDADGDGDGEEENAAVGRSNDSAVVTLRADGDGNIVARGGKRPLGGAATPFKSASGEPGKRRRKTATPTRSPLSSVQGVQGVQGGSTPLSL